jgi:peptidoglycan/LPS O-acetylase OafA/YrhL
VLGDVLAERIARATPPGRDRGVDALRAIAILGVVAGHWLVSAWDVVEPGRLVISSPLAFMPELAPLSWLLQTLAVFFFVGGYAASRSLRSRTDHRAWLRGRVARLLGPVVPLLAVWAVLAGLLTLGGMGARSLRALAVPALGPLWFLTVFTLLTVATPVLLRVPRVTLAAGAAGVVVAADVARFGFPGAEWAGWANVVAVWTIPYVLGIAWERGELPRRCAPWLLAGGAGTAIVLVTAFGYPVSMVGVTGERLSNLSPPSLAAAAFGIGQVGLAMLLREPLGRLARRPRLWAAIALANLSAMPIFLWHQTALTLAALAVLPLGGPPGLVGVPSDLGWVAQRLVWLPVLAALLALLGKLSVALASFKIVPRWPTGRARA